MAGGGEQALAGVLDLVGGDAVHGGPGGGRHGLADGGGDQRVDELQPSVGRVGQHLVPAQVLDRPGGGRGPLGADGGGEAGADFGAENGCGPGEPQAAGAEFVEPVPGCHAAGLGGQRAQVDGVLLDRFELLVEHLVQQHCGVVGVAAGDRPHLATEGVLGAVPEPAADQCRDRGGFQRAQVVPVRGPRGQLCEERGMVGELVTVGQDHQHGQLTCVGGDGDQPAERLRVRPVEVVHHQHQRGPEVCEPGEHEVETVPYALRIELPGRRHQPDCGPHDVAPRPEDLLPLGLGERADDRAQQLAHHVEGIVALLLTAPGEQDVAPCVAGGRPPHLGKQGGLPQAGRAGAEQNPADPGGAPRRSPEGSDRLLGRAELRLPLVRGPGTGASSCGPLAGFAGFTRLARSALLLGHHSSLRRRCHIAL